MKESLKKGCSISILELGVMTSKDDIPTTLRSVIVELPPFIAALPPPSRQSPTLEDGFPISQLDIAIIVVDEG